MRLSGELLLTGSDVRQVLAWPALTEAAPSVTGQLPLARALPRLKARALLSPGVMLVKADPRPRGGPAFGFVMVFDPAKDGVVTILDSADTIAMRAAALATVAAESLAAQASQSLAIPGAGPVAKEVLAALSTRVPISRAPIWSRPAEKADDRARSTARPVNRYASPGDVARRATSRLPYLADDLANGTVVLALEADRLGKRERGAPVLEGVTIIADQRGNVLKVGASRCPAAENRSSMVAELSNLLVTDARVNPK